MQAESEAHRQLLEHCKQLDEAEPARSPAAGDVRCPAAEREALPLVELAGGVAPQTALVMPREPLVELARSNPAHLDALREPLVELARHNPAHLDALREPLVELARRNPAHLDAFVRCNSRIFLDPNAVGGDITAPLATQLERFLAGSTASPAFLDAAEVALRTGVVEGEANGDEMEDDGELLAERWMENPTEAWATIITLTLSLTLAGWRTPPRCGPR